MENRGKIIGMSVMAIAMIGVFVLTSDDSSPAPKKVTPQAQITDTLNVPAQQAIPEKVIIKEPEVLTLEALPSLTLADKTYIRNLALEEEERHKRTMAEYQRDLAKLNNEIESFGFESGTNMAKGGASNSNVGKSTSPQMAMATESSVSAETSEEEDRLFVANQAFSAIQLKSLSSNVDGISSAWLQINGGLLNAEKGKVFGDFYIQDVTDSRVIIAHAPTNTARAFGIDGVQLVSKPSKAVTSPIPKALANGPVSVSSIRQSQQR